MLSSEILHFFLTDCIFVNYNKFVAKFLFILYRYLNIEMGCVIMSNENVTIKQHYIPRMLLKRHIFIPGCEPSIYQYDKLNHVERTVNVNTVCYKKYLYELRDSNGSILSDTVNVIENYFSFLEGLWSGIIRKLIYHEPLSNDDKSLLCLLIVMQLLRTPEAIDINTESIKKVSPDISDVTASQFSRLASFMHGKMSFEQNWLLEIIADKIYDGRYFGILYSDIPFLLNGERPVFVVKAYQNSKENFLLPVCSHICIGLFLHKFNFGFLHLTESQTQRLNYGILYNGGRFVYSSASIISNYNYIWL